MKEKDFYSGEDENCDHINKDKKRLLFFHNKIFTVFVIILLCVLGIFLKLIYEGYYIYDINSNQMFLEKDLDEQNIPLEYTDSTENLSYENIEEEVNKQKLKEINSNLIVKDNFFNINNEIIILVENRNNELIKDAYVCIIFYDGEDKPIYVTQEMFNINKNSEMYLKFFDISDDYERYEIITYTKSLNTCKDCSEYITFNTKENNNNLIIQGMNNYQDKVDEVTFNVIYYDENDKIIDVDQLFCYDIRKNKKFTAEGELGIIDKKNYENIEFSRYEVKMTSAYCYSY